MSIAKPFTFVANTYAKASEVNANFDTVYSQVNSNISAISQNAADIENLENNKADINGNTAQRFAVADAVTDNDAINKRSLKASMANSIDYISGYVITKDSGNPNNTIIVSAGSCYDSTKTVVLNKTNSSTKTNSSQAASATYHVYVIGNTTGSQINILISTSSVTPGLPTGYTRYRKIGSYTTNSDGNIAVIYSLSNSNIVYPDEIVNDALPDYDREVSLSVENSVPVQIPRNAYVYVEKRGAGSNIEVYVRTTRNGTNRQVWRQTGQGTYNNPSATLFPISKNEWLYITGEEPGAVKYYPLKGDV